MGEIIGGVIVMALFVGFIMWKGKNKAVDNNEDPMRRIHEEQYWAEKDTEKTEVTSFDSDDSDDGGDD